MGLETAGAGDVGARAGVVILAGGVRVILREVAIH